MRVHFTEGTLMALQEPFTHKDPEEDKYGSEMLSYEGFAGGKIQSVGFTRDYFSKSTNISATFKGTSESDMQTVKALLEKAGFENVQIKPPRGGESSFGVSVYQNGDKGLAAFAAALATDHDLGRGETLYRMMDPKDAQKIVTDELTRTGVSMQQAGLMKVSVMSMDNVGGQRYGVGVQAPSYKDVDLGGYPFSAIQFMREDGFVSTFVEKHTGITVREGMEKAVQEKLEASGFKVDRQEGSSYLSVSAKPNGREANVDNISDALAGASLIPAQAVQEISAVQPQQAAAPAAPAAPKQSMRMG